MKKIAIVTCEEIPALIPTEQPVIPALIERGCQAQAVVWTDSSVQWNTFDLVVMRNVWDYFMKYEAFMAWLEKLQTQGIKVSNPIEVIKANSHKFYLENLRSQGIPIVPTVFARQNSSVDLQTTFNQQHWQEGIVKPAVSAGAYKTYKIDQAEAKEYQTKVDDLLQNRDILIQEFLPEIQTDGEWSLLFFNGKYSHAVRKVPKNQDFRVQSEFGGQTLAETPAAFIIEQAQKIIDLYDQPLLYVRVDGVVAKGSFLLMELELIEPELFLDQHSHAVSRFAEAIIHHL